ncbi:hypothetical protein V1478_015910 [Vespula squamosa]|uniref:Uncharacterized protein n=1 Tax=Vespula squamosa TaxID=30214 RepID=A0ABD2A4U2_VESSQ
MTINVMSLLSAITAMRTLKSWCLAAFVTQVSIQIMLVTKSTWTLWTQKLLPATTREGKGLGEK